MTLNSVVLPAPLAPITALRSPAATENETSSTAFSAPKLRETPSEPERVPGRKELALRRIGDRCHGLPLSPTGSSARRASLS
jgi:hypothetical protein